MLAASANEFLLVQVGNFESGAIGDLLLLIRPDFFFSRVAITRAVVVFAAASSWIIIIQIELITEVTAVVLVTVQGHRCDCLALVLLLGLQKVYASLRHIGFFRCRSSQPFYTLRLVAPLTDRVSHRLDRLLFHREHA